MTNQQNQVESDYISPGEAATLLGVSVRTLSRMADNGTMPVTILPSGHRRYEAQIVREFREARTA
ncbi:hypothetical protein ALI44B_04640 [Leifsonia sp. ALI-44-B]|uniref:helix-turn-helix domain-containing protein n=1 Tax=Leifsonia sp. ALI-44-B TaxID=1933776 RepID=UPI00097CB705|nr:helix-turn-helix domain-containing protein [Leifsonia sp. ALI-44-B]ONI63918.1 hypothetical protein ALI44B_04640 [Leifsonia sp. ALI-44-B]